MNHQASKLLISMLAATVSYVLLKYNAQYVDGLSGYGRYSFGQPQGIRGVIGGILCLAGGILAFLAAFMLVQTTSPSENENMTEGRLVAIALASGAIVLLNGKHTLFLLLSAVGLVRISFQGRSELAFSTGGFLGVLLTPVTIACIARISQIQKGKTR